MAEAAHTRVSEIYQASSKLAKFPFEPYWPEKKLKICVTGAGGFIARCGLACREAYCSMSGVPPHWAIHLRVRIHTAAATWPSV